MALKVDPTNTDQARAWDGEEGAYWADNAQRFDRSVAGYHPSFMEAAAIGPADKVVDIGCGTGQTTRDAARAAPQGTALGVDLSARMIALARRLAAGRGISNARFEQADAQIHPFPEQGFDVAISRTGTMFFGDAGAAFANIGRALSPGGRLIMLVWQGPGPNEWIRALSGALAAGRDLPAPTVGAPGPFAQADPDQVTAMLGSAGYSKVEIEGLSRPMWFGSDGEDAERFVVGLMGWMLQGLDAAGRNRALTDLRATLDSHQTPGGVVFESATWLVRAAR